MNDRITASNTRWTAAVCYLSVLVLIPIFFVKTKDDFLARHCRQGFALLFLQVFALILMAVIDETIGIIPILGMLISFLLHLCLTLIFLGLSAIGFIKALSGESWRVHIVDNIADRVPVHAD